MIKSTDQRNLEIPVSLCTIKVYKDADSVIAEDKEGRVVAEGIAGEDDASVIQSTADETDRGKIYLDGTDFYLESPIQTKSYIGLIGAGAGCTKLYIKEGNTYAIEIYGSSSTDPDRLKRVEIRDLSILQESGISDKNVDGIRIKWADKLYISNVHIDWIGGRGIDIQSSWESFFTNLRLMAGNVSFGTETIRVTDTDGRTANDQSNHLFFGNIIIGGYGRLVTVTGQDSNSAPHGITFLGVESESPLDSTVDYAYYFDWAYLITMSQVNNYNIKSNIFYAKDVSRLYISDSEFVVNSTTSGKQGFEISSSNLYLQNCRFIASDRVLYSPTPTLKLIKASNCRFESLESDAAYYLQSLDKLMFVNCEFVGASGCYGLHVSRADGGCYIENVYSSPNELIADGVKNSGTATFSGDGTTKSFSFAHGLVEAPSHVEISPKSDDATGSWKWSADATNITITFMTAPPSGTDNIVFSWRAEVS